jgi:hypothetical protein
VKSGEVVLNVQVANRAKFSVLKLFEMREFRTYRVSGRAIQRVRENEKGAYRRLDAIFNEAL